MENNILIDTNVLLRYLLDDIEEMALIAEHLIDGGAWTTPEVLAEITYVLESVYDLPRADIHAALCIIANLVELRPCEATLSAIKEYGETKLDFVDCMMTAYSRACGERVFTFDKEINRRLSERTE